VNYTSLKIRMPAYFDIKILPETTNEALSGMFGG